MSEERVQEMARSYHEKNWLQRTFADRLYLSLIGVLAVFAVTVVYIFGAILRSPITQQTVDVTVELNSGAGLFVGSNVTYRGKPVGKVREIGLTTQGIEASVEIEPGTEIPVDSLVKVRSLSPVGEQYLDFQPKVTGEPYLKTGDTVPVEVTELPETLASVVIGLDELLSQVDSKKVRKVLVALATGLEETGPSINRLIGQSEVLFDDLDKLWPETDRLLDNSSELLDIAPAKAGTLKKFGKDAKELATFLKDYDPELRKTLSSVPDQIKTLRGLVKDANELFPPWIGNALAVSDFFMGYEPHFRATMTVFGPGLGALGRSVRDEQLKVVVYAQDTTRCKYTGNPPRDGRAPYKPLAKGGSCPSDFPNLQRGAAHAPGPVQ